MLTRSVLSVCLCLLTLALVVVIAMARDPNGFSLKEWQTITASFIALCAATLAYSAAMAKIHFDERTAQEDERRKTLGIFLRFDFAVDVLRYEAENHVKKIFDPPTSPSENSSVVVDDLTLSEMLEIKEAWENLDYFPVKLSKEFYEVQNQLYNFANFKKDHAGENYPSVSMMEHKDVSELRGILRNLHGHCIETLRLVRSETAKIA
jgi:hypothetical protein